MGGLRAVPEDGLVSTLRLHDTMDLVPPPDRGALLTAAQVAERLMPSGTTERYVRRHVYPRVPLGRKLYFYEADVKDWLEQQRVKELHDP